LKQNGAAPAGFREPEQAHAGFHVMLLEDFKKTAEEVTGIARPSEGQARALVWPRSAHAHRFADDGATPNHPRWPLIHYREAVTMDIRFDPAAIFETLFTAHGWGAGWRDGIYDFLHFHSRLHEVLGIARGQAVVRFGGDRGSDLTLTAGDVIVQPAGTGHQRISASDDLLVVGAYPLNAKPGEAYDECRATPEAHDRALAAIAAAPPPQADPVYGEEGALMRLWS
jgi:uncharacterized protein YjlB